MQGRRSSAPYSRPSDEEGASSDSDEAGPATRRSSRIDQLRASVASVVSIVEERIEVGTVGGTTLNTVCNVVGAGVLTLPQAFERLGVATGSIVCLLMCLDGMFSAYVLFVACERSGTFSMNNCFAISVLGKEPIAALTNDALRTRYRSRKALLAMLVDIMVCVYTYLLLTVYCGLMADSMVSVLKQFAHAEGIWVDRLTWISVSTVIFAVFTSARTMSELKWSSFIGIVTIMWAVLAVLIKCIAYGHQGGGSMDSANVWTPTSMAPSAVGVLSVAFGYHLNAPIFYGELHERSPLKMMKTVVYSFPLIYIVYLIIAVAGYLSFAPHVKGIIIDNYSDYDTVMNTVRLGLFFHFACVYPVISVCLRLTAHRVGLIVAGRREVAESLEAAAATPRWVIVVEALLIVTSSSAITYGYPDVGKMVNLIGALTGNNFIMTIPGVVGLCVWAAAPSDTGAEGTDERAPLTAAGAVGALECGGTKQAVEDEESAPTSQWVPPPHWKWRRSILALSFINVVLGVVFTVMGFAGEMGVLN